MLAEQKIIALQICPGYRKPMTSLDEVEAIPNLGLKDDAHAKADSSRQVLLIEKETLDALNLQPGDVKENITTSGIELMKLEAGTQLQLGKEVVVEITKPCAPCSRMEEIRPGLLKEIAGRRGMLARVVAGGKLRRRDAIQIVQNNA
ncbi:MAG: MOSC domain-containing protein [Ignavibacteriales bacterium]|nr:MOSC domain-containing protein [Ignavibacteriales bacterium]